MTPEQIEAARLIGKFGDKETAINAVQELEAICPYPGRKGNSNINISRELFVGYWQLVKHYIEHAPD